MKDPPGEDGIYRVFKSIEVETFLLLICSLLTLMLIRDRRGDESMTLIGTRRKVQKEESSLRPTFLPSKTPESGTGDSQFHT